jgi:hypothetical protein
MRQILRITLLGIAFAATFSANVATVAGHSYAGPRAYYCEYPKSITAEGHTVTTPEICVPSP